jgi:aspartate/methionine/tyrosine aminotransferase
VFPTAREAEWFKTFNINVYSCVPAYNQMGARLAIESPESAPEIRRMVAAFQERRDVVVRGLNAIEGIRCRTPGGAFYAFPNVAGACETLGAFEAHRRLPEEARRNSSPSSLLQMFLLYRHHVATMDRRSFGVIGSEGRHYLRVSIATGLDDLKDALVRIATATREPERFAAFVREGRYAC